MDRFRKILPKGSGAPCASNTSAENNSSHQLVLQPMVFPSNFLENPPRLISINPLSLISANSLYAPQNLVSLPVEKKNFPLSHVPKHCVSQTKKGVLDFTDKVCKNVENSEENSAPCAGEAVLEENLQSSNSGDVGDENCNIVEVHIFEKGLSCEGYNFGTKNGKGQDKTR